MVDLALAVVDESPTGFADLTLAAVAAMAAVLGTRSATPPTKDDELVHRVRTVRSAVHGFVSLELSGGFGLPQDIDESFEHLISTLVTGLRLTPAAAAARTEPVA